MVCSSLRRGALALLLVSIPSLGQAGLTPRLVRDIDETSYAGSSTPRQFGEMEFGLAFTAFGGRELWIHSERERRDGGRHRSDHPAPGDAPVLRLVKSPPRDPSRGQTVSDRSFLPAG